MPGTLLISGVSVLDQTFTLDAEGFPSWEWNTTRMEQDAFRGRFGAPEEHRFDEHRQWENPDDEWRHVDKGKITRFIQLAEVPAIKPDWKTKGEVFRRYNLIDIPTVSLIVPHPATGQLHVFPVDGNHRMLARKVMKRQTYSTFIVPPELEGDYRIRYQEI
jgi:hypothetical protein